MSDLKNLTVLIVTYKTEKKILFSCLKSIDKNVKIIIIENSKRFDHSDLIKNFKNVKFFCSGKNLGYGKGNNFGLKKINTRFVLILNPDIICGKSLFKNISLLIKKKINFHLIGCQYLKDKVFMPAGFFDKEKNKIFKNHFRKNKQNLIKVDWIAGCSILIDTSKFKFKNIFDKNFFLYFEEFDLCKRIIEKGGNIFTCKNLKIHHLGFKSSLGKNLDNEFVANNVRNWHWMWSSFYFYKKNYGLKKALKKLSGKFFKSLIKTIFYSLTFQNNKKNKYLYRFLGVLSAMIGKPSSFRGK